jgi:hypothetical protein
MPNGLFRRLLVVTLVAFPCAALAAEVKALSGKDGRITVLIDGDLQVGDSNKFTETIKRANNDGKFVANVRLNSDGGNLLEGVNLADAVRYGKMSTYVGKTATCASACFLIFAAGNTKFASYEARIGVHGASDQNGDETIQSNAATISMARAAQDLGVPSAIIGRMVVTPPSDMVWLTPQDLQSMSTTMVGKPSQTRGPAISTPDQVLKQTPERSLGSLQSRSTSSSEAVEGRPPSWGGLLDTALSLSKEQNGGKPDFQRVCQPELKSCVNGLAFKAKDGTDMIMKVTENLDGKIIRREICSFNQYGDIRSCLDWDAGTTHRDVKNSSGEWEKASD